jgi:hypothetical protein
MSADSSFDAWWGDSGEYARELCRAVWHAMYGEVWNAAIYAALMKIPGGSICDPQVVADEIRSLQNASGKAREETATSNQNHE